MGFCCFCLRDHLDECILACAESDVYAMAEFRAGGGRAEFRIVKIFKDLRFLEVGRLHTPG